MKRKKTDAPGTFALAYPESADPTAFDEESEARKTDSGWFASVVMVHVVAGFIAYVAYLTWHAMAPHVNGWRADRIARTATASMAKGDYDAASSDIATAARLSLDRPAVLRAQAQFYSHYHDPHGLPYWRRWEESGALAARADHISYARLALACLRTDIARQVLKPLHLADPNDPEVLALISEIFELDGDDEQAISAIRDALTRDPSNRHYEVQLATLEVRSSVPGEQTAGKARLFALMTHVAEDRGPIARLMLIEGHLNADEERLFGQLLGPSRPNAPGEDLVRFAMQVRHDPTQIKAAMEEFLPVPRSVEVAVEAGRLLGALDLNRAVVELIPKTSAVRDRSLTLLRLGGLAACGRWDEMDQLLDVPDLPLPIAVKAIFRAGVAQYARQTHDAPRLWQLAANAVRGNAQYTELLAVRAEEWGAREPAIAAWEELLDEPLQAAHAARELLRLGALWHHLPATSVALRRVSQLHPLEPRFRLQLALSQLLLGHDENDARVTLKELEPVLREEPLYCVTAALAAVRASSPDAAADWISRPAIDWKAAPLAWRVVRVAALGISSQRSFARRVAEGIDVLKLSPSELDLISPWLADSSASR